MSKKDTRIPLQFKYTKSSDPSLADYLEKHNVKGRHVKNMLNVFNMLNIDPTLSETELYLLLSNSSNIATQPQQIITRPIIEQTIVEQVIVEEQETIVKENNDDNTKDTIEQKDIEEDVEENNDESTESEVDDESIKAMQEMGSMFNL